MIQETKLCARMRGPFGYLSQDQRQEAMPLTVPSTVIVRHSIEYVILVVEPSVFRGPVGDN